MTPNATTGADADRIRSVASRQRRAIAALLIVVFIAMSTIAAAALWLRRQEVLSEGRKRAESLALVISEELALRVEAIEAAMAQLADHNRSVGGPDAPYDQWLPVLSAARSGLKGVDSVSVTNAKGVVTYSTRTETIGQSQADKRIYAALKANPMSDALVADLPVRSPFDTTTLVPLGHVLRTPNGDFEGMLVATLAPAALGKFYRSLDVGENGFVWVLHAGGGVLLREPPFEKPLEQPARGIPIAEGNSGSTFGPIEPGGPDYLTAFRRGDEIRPAVAISLAADDLTALWRRDVRVALILLAASGALLLVAGLAIDRAARSALRSPSDSPRPP